MKWRSNSHNKTCMYGTLYSGHLSTVDTIFRSQVTSLSRTDLSIADTSNIRHFLQEIGIHFTLDNILQFRLSFLWSFLFYFLGSVMAFSGLWKFRDCKFVGISSPYSSLWLTYCPVAKMSKVQWDRDRTMDAIMEISVVHGQPLLLYSENQYQSQKQHPCSLYWLALLRVTNTRQPVASKLSYKHDIL